MDNEYVKKLTSKNPSDYETAASHIINSSDEEAFKSLVAKSDFLFDFIKENVKRRLANVITNFNYKNLLNFLKIYSQDYEEFIVSRLVRFADEDLTDEMLNRLENGIDEEKAYCAKYFSYINDTLAVELLRKNAYSQFSPLALNSAEALSSMNDIESYNLAIEKIKSEDEYEKLSAVNFLVAYKNTEALQPIFETMKKSSMPENIASEIPYLKSFLELIDTKYKYDVILALNYILSGFGEIVSLDQVFAFEIYDILSKLVDIQPYENDSKSALLLVNLKLKFEQLTENEEYIFDEDKIVKEEIYGIKEFIDSIEDEFWAQQVNLLQNELETDSEFVFFALEIVQEMHLESALIKLKNLLKSSNQTLILKSVEVIKSLEKINEIDKNEVLSNITDKNIRLIIESNFNQ